VTPNSVGIVDPRSGEIVGEIRVGRNPGDIAYDADERRLWVANLEVETISELDPESRTLVDTFNAGQSPSAIAAGEGAVWVANQFANQISVFDPGLDDVTRTIDEVSGPKDVAVGFGAVWVAKATDRTVVRIDVRTDEVAEVGPGTAVAVGPRSVWVANGRNVTPLDPETGRTAGRQVTLRFEASQLAVGADGSVWVTHEADDAVSRVDPRAGTFRTFENVANDPTGIAVGEGFAWVAGSLGRELVRIGVATGQSETRIPLGSSPQDVAVADGYVWVTTRARA
jgi:DNA-binding beta-propeller fold protein YncE